MHKDFIYIPEYNDYIRIDSIDKIQIRKDRPCTLDNGISVLLRCGVLYKYSYDNLKYFEKITGDLNDR